MVKRAIGVAFLAALLFLTAGCKSRPAKPVIKTYQVEVPVPTMPTPPEALAQCGTEKAGFRFYSDGVGGLNILYADLPKFKAWVEGRTNCLRAWRAWASKENN